MFMDSYYTETDWGQRKKIGTISIGSFVGSIRIADHNFTRRRNELQQSFRSWGVIKSGSCLRGCRAEGLEIRFQATVTRGLLN